MSDEFANPLTEEEKKEPMIVTMTMEQLWLLGKNNVFMMRLAQSGLVRYSLHEWNVGVQIQELLRSYVPEEIKDRVRNELENNPDLAEKLRESGFDVRPDDTDDC